MELASVEEQMVKAFIVPERRERWLLSLKNPNRRDKILRRLDHHVDDFSERYRISIPSGLHTAAQIENLLRTRGAPSNCYVISSLSEFDGREMALSVALAGIVGHGMGSVISCIPGKLGFYEPEEMKTRYLLERAV